MWREDFHWSLRNGLGLWRRWCQTETKHFNSGRQRIWGLETIFKGLFLSVLLDHRRWWNDFGRQKVSLARTGFQTTHSETQQPGEIAHFPKRWKRGHLEILAKCSRPLSYFIAQSLFVYNQRIQQRRLDRGRRIFSHFRRNRSIEFLAQNSSVNRK